MTRLSKSLVICPCLFAPQTTALSFETKTVKTMKPGEKDQVAKSEMERGGTVDGLLNPGG